MTDIERLNKEVHVLKDKVLYLESLLIKDGKPKKKPYNELEFQKALIRLRAGDKKAISKFTSEYQITKED